MNNPTLLHPYETKIIFKKSYLYNFLKLLSLFAIVIAFSGAFPLFKNLSAILNNAFFMSGLLGSSLIYCFYYQSIKIVRKICLLATLFICTTLLLNTSASIFSHVVLSLWLATLYHLGTKKNPLSSQTNSSIFLLTIFLPCASLLGIIFIYWTILFDHKTQDWLLYATDATFGWHLNFLAGYAFFYMPTMLKHFFLNIYATLPLAWAIAVCIVLSKDQLRITQLWSEFLILGLIGMSLYHIIPAYGPCYAFLHQWPLHAPSTPIIPPIIDDYGFLPRNCMPSLHAAWSFCIWRHACRSNKIIQVLATIWLLCMLFTLPAIGQHYIVDIIMGFCLTVLVRGLCATSLSWRDVTRRNTIFIGAALCILWYICILFGLQFLRLSILIPWTLLLLTLFLAGRAEHRLAHAQHFIYSSRLTTASDKIRI